MCIRDSSVGEDYLPLHELSTNSKRTTCLPPHMVCEVHHTKSGYEQLESRSSPCRPTRSSTSPKRMRYDLFRPQFEAESPSGRSARSAFSDRDRRWASRSTSLRRSRQPSGSATGAGAVLARLIDERAASDVGGAGALLCDIADKQYCRSL